MRLALLLTDTRATPHDLLEVRHRADALIQDDELDHLAVHPRGEELAGRSDHGVVRGDRDEVIELGAPIGITPRDTHHVVWILPTHIFIGIHQSCAHTLCMILISAEDDGLRHAIGMLEVACDLLCDLSDAVLDDDTVVVVRIVVYPILDLHAMDIGLALDRAPFIPDIGRDVHDLEWSKEAIIDPLLEAIGIDRLAEVGYR